MILTNATTTTLQVWVDTAWCRASDSLYSSGCSGLLKRQRAAPLKEQASDCMVRNPLSTQVQLKCGSSSSPIATTLGGQGTYNVDVRFCRCPPSVRADPAKSAGYDTVVLLEKGKLITPGFLGTPF